MRVLLSILLLSVAVPVHAAEEAPAVECNYGGNQQEMNACALRDYKTADQSLNGKYKEVMTALPADKQLALRTEQRAWLKKRDPHCKAQAKPSEGGSIWPLEYYGCLQASTEQRTKQLERWLGK